MEKKVPFSLVFMTGCFITGNMIGAGILGLPIKTGVAGFIPSLIGLSLLSCALFFTAIILAKESIKRRQPIFHYPTLYGEYFGSFGKWLAIIANLIILYGLITIYLTGSVAIITRLINIPVPKFVVTLIFFVIFTMITITNPRFLLRCSTLFVVLLWLAFAVIVIMGERYVDTSRYTYTDWGMFPAALPIMVMAANYHNIIPTVCKKLKWDLKSIVTAFLFGSIIGFIMNALWIQIGIGVLPLQGSGGLLEALQKNIPATVPLANAIRTPVFLEASLLFALLAIITSYISIGNTHVDFIDDIIVNHTRLKSSKILTLVLAFAPPLVITLIYPDIFLNTLDFVGGIGKVLLFGVLPCIIALITMRSLVKRILFVVPTMLLFAGIFLFKLGQELHLVRNMPKTQYWKYNFTPYNRNYEKGDKDA
ncbi:MAG: hypothetical protein HQ579_05750 [Candidatus Omnitrophica bacterium]|nr:hypothetical protein [Candidatus Omnitrophota bacterium]